MVQSGTHSSTIVTLSIRRKFVNVLPTNISGELIKNSIENCKRRWHKIRTICYTVDKYHDPVS